MLGKKEGKRKSATYVCGVIMTLAVVLFAVAGMFWTPYDVTEMNGSLKNAAPSFLHLFGTDNFGRDVFSRVLSGASTSFIIAFLVVFVGGFLGTVIGALTGYFGGIFDEILMRVNDCLASFPSVLLALVVIAVTGSGKYKLVIALGIAFIPSFVRVVRGEVKKQKELDYVKNVKLMGAGSLHIIFIDILPNIRTALSSSLLIGFQNAILSEAGMSYLGLGVTPPDPSLGRMLSEAQSYLFYAPWYAIMPGLTIFILTLGLGLISHGRKQ